MNVFYQVVVPAVLVGVLFTLGLISAQLGTIVEGVEVLVELVGAIKALEPEVEGEGPYEEDGEADC